MNTQQKLCELLEQRIGIRVQASERRRTVETFVATRVSELGFTRPAQYLELLAGESLTGAEFSRLVATVTNTHTFFYRDGGQLEALADLLRRLRRERGRRLYIWCAACSTGEEPYTVAMLCEEGGIDASILATDINGEALDIARAARYRDWSLRHLPHRYRQRYFVGGGDAHVVAPTLRKRVELRFHNLLDELFPRPVIGRWDIVLCRNVFIYFDGETIERVARRFSHVIDPAGWLMLSATEGLHGYDTPFRLAHTEHGVAYQLAPATSMGLAAVGTGPMPAFDLTSIDEPPPARPRPPQPANLRPPPGQHGADAAYAQVALRLQRGDRASATSALDQLLERWPGHVVGTLTRGNLALLSHDFDRAIAAYEHAQELSPLMAETHYLSGVVYRKLGDMERAMNSLRHALFLHPGFWCASFLLGGIYGRLGQQAQQARCLRNALTAIRQSGRTSLFSSYVQGMRDLDLPVDEVVTLCERQLSR